MNNWRAECCWLVLLCACTGDAFLGFQPVAPAIAPTIVDAGVADPAGDAAPPRAAMTPDAALVTPALALQAHKNGAPLSELRLVCPDRCASIELAAIGGTPPYAYSWDDGASAVTRVLCPDSATPIHASVRDALGHTALIELPVQLQQCAAEPLCVANPSFEGSPTLGAEWLGSASLRAEAWNDCRNADAGSPRSLPRVVDSASGDEFPAPTDGSTYLYLPTHEDVHGFVGQALCAPLQAGHVYYFKIDLAYAAEDSAGVPLEPGQLEIYGARDHDACSRSELLWASPPLHTAFRAYCVALQPSTLAAGLVFSPTGVPAKDSAVFVDHLQSVTNCP